jgi:hypothetical protein
MKEGLENIDRLFRENLIDFSSNPPEEAWGRIEKSLSQNRKKIVIPFYLKIAAGILLIIGLTTLTWRYINETSPKVELTQNEIILPQQPSSSQKNNGSYVGISNQEQPISTLKESKSQKKSPEKQPALNPSIETQTAQEAAENHELLTANNEIQVLQESDTVTVDLNPILPEVSSEKNVAAYEQEAVKPVANDLIIQQNILSLNNNDDGQNQKSVDWLIGGQAGPQYSYRNVYTNSYSAQNYNFDEYEKGIVAYAGGVQIAMEPSKRFSFQSGIFYSKIGQTKNNVQLEDRGQIDQTWVITPNDIVNSTGNFTFDKSLPPPVYSTDNPDWQPGIVTAEQYFEFVEIPFICSYKVIDKKLDVSLSGGIWADFLVGNKAFATDNKNFSIEGSTEDINNFNYSASVSVGFNYPLANRLNVNLQPLFKYYLAPINTNPQTEVYPYTFSLMTGLLYAF